MKKTAAGLIVAAATLGGGLASYAQAPDGSAAEAECESGPFIVFFDWNKADITPEAATILDSAITAYVGCNNAPVRLAGYTDRSGSSRYNEALAARRDDSVRAYLTNHGMPAGAVSSEPLGEAKPRVPTPDGAREAQNRRVEITFGDKKAK